MIAPRVATRIDQMLNPVTPLPPSNCTTKPPTSAPIIPMTMVSRKPPGSRPGIISLPKTPAISPTTIQLMMPISIFFSYLLSSRSTYLFSGISAFRRTLRAHQEGRVDLELRLFINFFRVSLSFLFFVVCNVREHPADNQEVTEPQPHLENVHRHALAPWGRIHTDRRVESQDLALRSTPSSCLLTTTRATT